MVGNERRRHVRLKPLPDLPARITFAGGGLFREALDVVDISVGGLSIASPSLRGTQVGQRLNLNLMLGLRDEYAIDILVRWVSNDAIGVEVVDAPPSTAKAIERYVTELLERGGGA